MTEADKEALIEARALLITEMALALEQSWELTERSVDDAIGRGIRDRQEADARALEEAMNEALNETVNEAVTEEEGIATDWSFPVQMKAELSEAAD